MARPRSNKFELLRQYIEETLRLKSLAPLVAAIMKNTVWSESKIYRDLRSETYSYEFAVEVVNGLKSLEEQGLLPKGITDRNNIKTNLLEHLRIVSGVYTASSSVELAARLLVFYCGASYDNISAATGLGKAVIKRNLSPLEETVSDKIMPFYEKVIKDPADLELLNSFRSAEKERAAKRDVSGLWLFCKEYNISCGEVKYALDVCSLTVAKKLNDMSNVSYHELEKILALVPGKQDAKTILRNDHRSLFKIDEATSVKEFILAAAEYYGAKTTDVAKALGVQRPNIEMIYNYIVTNGFDIGIHLDIILDKIHATPQDRKLGAEILAIEKLPPEHDDLVARCNSLVSFGDETKGAISPQVFSRALRERVPSENWREFISVQPKYEPKL